MYGSLIHQWMVLQPNLTSFRAMVSLWSRPPSQLYVAVPRRCGRFLALGDFLLFALAGPGVGTTKSSICVWTVPVCSSMIENADNSR